MRFHLRGDPLQVSRKSEIQSEVEILAVESHIFRCFKVNVETICFIDVQYFDALFVVV